MSDNLKQTEFSDPETQKKYEEKEQEARRCVEKWRKSGHLDGITPGSWEEKMTALLLENQAVMRECDATA